MKVYVLTKEYLDKSGFAITGVTADRAVAQAFVAGGEDGLAQARVYERDLEAGVYTFNEAPGCMKQEEL